MDQKRDRIRTSTASHLGNGPSPPFHKGLWYSQLCWFPCELLLRSSSLSLFFLKFIFHHSVVSIFKSMLLLCTVGPLLTLQQWAAGGDGGNTREEEMLEEMCHFISWIETFWIINCRTAWFWIVPFRPSHHIHKYTYGFLHNRPNVMFICETWKLNVLKKYLTCITIPHSGSSYSPDHSHQEG